MSTAVKINLATQTLAGNSAAVVAALNAAGVGGRASYTTVSNAAARYALAGVKVGDIAEQSDTHHRWLACDLSRITTVAGWNDLGIYVPGPLFYSGGTVTPDVSGWTITGGWALVQGNSVFITGAATGIVAAETGGTLDGTYDATQFTSLTSLRIGNVVITSPPVLTGLIALASLSVESCSALATQPDLNTLTGLTALNMSGTAITSFSVATGTAPLVTLTSNSCTGLTSVSLGGASSTLLHCDLSYCALVQSSVDGVLAALDGSELTLGSLILSGGTNAAPTDSSHVDSLLAKGWSVTTN